MGFCTGLLAHSGSSEIGFPRSHLAGNFIFPSISALPLKVPQPALQAFTPKQLEGCVRFIMRGLAAS